MQTSPVVLSAHDVARRYGSQVALDGASLEVAAGECVALVGESGSGKTTLLRCFNRMTEWDTGEVRVEGVDARTLEPVELRRRMGYVPQDGGLLPHWSVLRNVALVPWLRGQSDAEQHASEALEWVGLPAERFGRRWPRDLSGGQRQRVAIARALAASPRIMLLDEPFGALDAITRAELQASFSELRRRMGVSALFVTHDLHEAALLADRVAVLRAGRVEQVAAVGDLLRNPATDYVRDLLARARMVAA
jgi:osmoprotectant transport system ATP-binding protein